MSSVGSIKPGGSRADATGNTDATGRVPSRAQASIAQFGSHDSRQSGDYSFRNCGYKQSPMRIGRRQCSIASSGCVAKNQGLDRGAIHDHAGPHPFFLRTYGISTVRFPRLDGMLETHGVEPLSVSARAASLAEGLLGYAVAQRRQLCRQMGVCARQSCAERISGECGSLAVSGRVECSHVA